MNDELLTARDLCQRVLAGEQGAFRALVLRDKPRVVAQLKRWGADAATAEDLAQEAFVVTWTNLSSGRMTELKSPAYPRTVAYHLFLKVKAKQGRALPIKSERDGRDLEARVAARDHLAAVWQTLERRCTARQREVFLLRFRDGLSARQIGEAMDMTEQRARQVLWEVRKVLRQAEAKREVGR